MTGLARQFYDRWRFNWFLYPGIAGYRAPDFLTRYYEWRKSRMGPLRKLANALVYGYFWLWIPRRARKVARHWDKDEQWVRRIVPLAREWMTDPEDFATFDIDGENDLRVYQRRMEQIPVIRTMESASTDHAVSLLDKAVFQSRCETLGLPVPALLATVTGGMLEFSTPLAPDSEVLAKPRSGSGGAGISVFAAAELHDGKTTASRFGNGDWLVQERLPPHPGLADIALDALPTVRMVTMLDERAEPELVAAAIRFAARRNVPVDNGHAGGLIAGVGFADGRLREGLSGWGPGRFPEHPESGMPITGRVVPGWDEAKALVSEAHHRLFAASVIIGWDVGIAAGGPVLIEANPRPAVRLTQRAAGMGIGQMRYGELVAYHLDRAIRDRPDRTWRHLSRG